MKSILRLGRHPQSDDSKKKNKNVVADKESMTGGSKKKLRFPSFKRISKRASATLKLTPIDKSEDARASANKGTGDARASANKGTEKPPSSNTISVQGRTLEAAAEDATLSGRSHDEDSLVEEALVDTESKQQVDIEEVAFLKKESSDDSEGGVSKNDSLNNETEQEDVQERESPSSVEQEKSTEESPHEEAEQDRSTTDESLAVEEVQPEHELESEARKGELSLNEADDAAPAVLEDEECTMEAHPSDKGKSTEESPQEKSEQDRSATDESLAVDELESEARKGERSLNEADDAARAVLEDEECAMEAHPSDEVPPKAGIPSVIKDCGPVPYIESLSTTADSEECQSARETKEIVEAKGFRILPKCSSGGGVSDDDDEDENDAGYNEWDYMGMAMLAGASSMTFLRSGGRGSTIAALIGTTAVMGTYWLFHQQRRINSQKDQEQDEAQ